SRSSQRPWRAIPVDSLLRAAGGGWDRGLGGEHWRLVRQRSRRDDQRALQSRADPPERAVAQPRRGRVRHARVGRLVQQPPAAQLDRRRAAGRVRRDVQGQTTESDHGGRTQLTESPENPERFRGLMTCRDAWNYNSSRSKLLENARRMVTFFNEE